MPPLRKFKWDLLKLHDAVNKETYIYHADLFELILQRIGLPDKVAIVIRVGVHATTEAGGRRRTLRWASTRTGVAELKNGKRI